MESLVITGLVIPVLTLPISGLEHKTFVYILDESTLVQELRGLSATHVFLLEAL